MCSHKTPRTILQYTGASVLFTQKTSLIVASLWLYSCFFSPYKGINMIKFILLWTPRRFRSTYFRKFRASNGGVLVDKRGRFTLTTRAWVTNTQINSRLPEMLLHFDSDYELKGWYTRQKPRQELIKRKVGGCQANSSNLKFCYLVCEQSFTTGIIGINYWTVKNIESVQYTGYVG